jgi:hypothetical protein
MWVLEVSERKCNKECRTGTTVVPFAYGYESTALPPTN